MDTTAKVSYEAKGKVWSDIVAHVDRLHKAGHYKNTNIDLNKTAELDKTGFKRIGYIHNSQLDNYKYFMPYILLQNIRKQSTSHKNEVYKSVHDYFRQRGYSNQRNSLFQISNMDDRKKYFHILEKKGLNDSQIRLIEARSLVDDVREYNKASCQSVGAYSVNVGEKGGAHIHFQNLSYPPKSNAGKLVNLMPRGKKWKRKLKRRLTQVFGLSTKDAKAIIKSGKLLMHKPVASFNNTWKQEFPEAKNKKNQFDSRVAIHLARHKYDPMVIHNFNKELAKAGVKGFRLHLIRTHNINHKNYPEWLTSKENNDKLQKANKSLTANNKGLKENWASISKSMAEDAVSNAKPTIQHDINSGINSASSSAESASASASSSASSAVSSARDSLADSNSEWQASVNNELSESVNSKIKKAKTSQSNALSQAISSATRSENIKYMTQDINIIAARSDANPSNIASLYDSGSTFNGSVMSGASLANYLDSSALNFEMDIANEEPAINSTIDSQSDKQSDLDSQASSITSASASVASFHDDLRNVMTDTLRPYEPSKDLHNYDDRTLLSKFKGFVNTVTSHLHRFHAKLKRTFHRLLPNMSDKDTTGLANGTLKLKGRTQEDLAFKIEDDNARAIYSKSAQAINSGVMEDHGEQDANEEPIKSGSGHEIE